MEYESLLQDAIVDLKSQARVNFKKTAERWRVNRVTLARRFRGETTTHQEATSSSRRQLSDTQEKTLLKYINTLSDRGIPPTPQIVRNIAEELARVSLGKCWVRRFCRRHRDQIKSVYLRTIDHKRKLADNSPHFHHFYETLQEKILKYDIKPSNMYNFDEKGFLIGISKSTKRIISAEALRSKRTARASQDGSREFITLIACICADGEALAPTLIYQGASRDLQDTWLEEFDHVKDQAFFASSENGWSSDELGRHWLEHVFNRLTKDKDADQRERRMVLVDGHSSHVNMDFIEYAHANRILIGVLPPHSTHRLQPLDVGLFSPLATYYTQEIDNLLSISQGLVRVTKRDFWGLFRPSWNQAFDATNVRNAWETTGIHPFQPDKVLSIFKRSKDSIISQVDSEKNLKTPTSARAIRREYRQLVKDGQVGERAKILLHAGEALATEVEILQHENRGLRQAILHEKKKRKRGKALNLFDPGENQQRALFFSPAKVERARQRIADEAEKEQRRKQNISDKRLQAAITRDEKARETQEKRVARALSRQIAREQVAREKAERQTARKAQQAMKAAENARRKRDAPMKQAERPKAKKAAQTTVKANKRSLEENESTRPPKRLRSQASPKPIAPDSHVVRNPLETIVMLRPPDASLTMERAQSPSRMRSVERRPISLPLRSGRTTRLPARFL